MMLRHMIYTQNSDFFDFEVSGVNKFGSIRVYQFHSTVKSETVLLSYLFLNAVYSGYVRNRNEVNAKQIFRKI